MAHKTQASNCSASSAAFRAVVPEDGFQEHRIGEYWAPERSGWQVARDLFWAGAVAVGLPDGHQINRVEKKGNRRTLVSTSHAIHELDLARTVAQSAEPSPLILACTTAREARALSTDEDRRDWRYLSGVRTAGGFHVYCGGLDAAVTRALAYAPYADVVCHRTSRLDLAEAHFFASAIRALFPDKPLAIGVSGFGRAGLQAFDYVCQPRNLSRLGYDDCFLFIAGAVIFPSFSAKRPWALFDDTPRTSPI